MEVGAPFLCHRTILQNNSQQILHDTATVKHQIHDRTAKYMVVIEASKEP